VRGFGTSGICGHPDDTPRLTEMIPPTRGISLGIRWADNMELDEQLKETLIKVAEFYDHRKVGDIGPLGFRRSTDLMTIFNCLGRMLDQRIIKPDETMFMDLGCGDGRLNVFLSYLVKKSVGIELDEWTLNKSGQLKAKLDENLKLNRLIEPPDNILLFHGDATDDNVHEKIMLKIGAPFKDFDLFYTYLVMHEEFARLIAQKAKSGSILMVYGLDKILPKYDGLQLLEDVSPMEGILALYQKA
jgi:SAM-dependent methyltransferase